MTEWIEGRLKHRVNGRKIMRDFLRPLTKNPFSTAQSDALFPFLCMKFPRESRSLARGDFGL